MGRLSIETVSPEGTFFYTVQVPSGADDIQLIQIEIRHPSGRLERKQCKGKAR